MRIRRRNARGIGAVASVAIGAIGALAALSAAPGCSKPGRAWATRIATRDELIGGPKALGQIGDYLLANDQIRVIIHGPGPNRGSTIFGGTLIDADLQRPNAKPDEGNDQLGEIFPSFLFEALDPEKVEVVRDGSDGGPATVRVTGVGGDLLQSMAVLDEGFLYPPGLVFTEEYTLEPGKRFVRIDTTITNDTDTVHPLPYFNPSDLAGLGLNIPGIDQLQLSVPMGHLALFGQEQELFATGKTGFDLRFSIQDAYATPPTLPAFPGLVSEILATRGNGVSYGVAMPDRTDDFVWSYKDGYAGLNPTEHSLLIPFIYASVTGVFHTNPPPVLAPHASFSYPIWFVVGNGDVGSVLDTVLHERGAAVGRVGGTVIDARSAQPVAKASVVVQDTSGNYVSQYDTDARGSFHGDLPPGSYVYRVVTKGRTPSAPVAFAIAEGKTTNLRPLLDPTASLTVQVRDDAGRAVPCKVMLLGKFDAAHMGQDPRTFLYDLHLGESLRSTAFDPARNDYMEAWWYTADGSVHADVRPGSYVLAVSRGPDYDLTAVPITLAPGGSASQQLTVHRSMHHPGWISADLHLHAYHSLDSRMSNEDRVTSIAGEGITFAAATDHNFITDYQPFIAKMHLEDWLVSTVGMELTTFEMGHFNGYPLRTDPGSVRGGEFQWAGEPPDSLFAQLRGLGKYGGANTIVEVNHPRDGVLGYFTQFNLDPATGKATTRQGLAGVFAPYKPEFAPDKFSLDFDALEVFNGKRRELIHTYRAPDPLPPPPLPSPVPSPGEIVRDAYGQVAFPGTIEDWFTLLNLGYRHTAVGNSDSHGGVPAEPGYARTELYVGPGKDTPGTFDERDVVKAIRAHAGVATDCPMIEMSVDGHPIGSDVTQTGSSAVVSVHATSADWCPFDHLTIYANGAPVLDESIDASLAHDFTESYTLALSTSDVWTVAEVSGSANLYPVVTPQELKPLSASEVIDALGKALDLSALDPYGNLRPARVYQDVPEAITNPVWIDHDGNGSFDPPLAALLARPAPKGAAVPDVDLRRIFREIPEARLP